MKIDIAELEKNNKYNMNEVNFSPADFGVFIFTLFNSGFFLGLAILSSRIFFIILFVIIAIINFLLMVKIYGRNN